jgi:hypothetical protein
MDILGGHLLHDHFARQLFAGPYTRDDDPPTPSKEPTPDKERGGSLDPNSFNDDQAPPKPMPTKPTPRGIERPDVPMLMEPQSLQVTRQPLMPGEMPAEQIPGENGKPMAPPMGMGMPGMMPPPTMPGVMSPQRMHAPGMPGLGPQRNAPPQPGLKSAPKTPSLKAPKPVSNSPAQKPPRTKAAEQAAASAEKGAAKSCFPIYLR